VLLVAAWFGLVAGLGETLVMLGLPKFQGGLWDPQTWFVHIRILWVAPTFNLLFFILLGLPLLLLGKVRWRINFFHLCVLAFGFLCFFAWLAAPDRIQLMGVIPLSLGLATVLGRWWNGHEATALSFMRRTLPGLLVLTAMLIGGVEGWLWWEERSAVARLTQAAPDTPNVLVVVVDTMRGDSMSALGYARPTTPKMDQLAREGVLFERAFSTSSWTLPAHASMLTGRYPHEHDAAGQLMSSAFPSLPEVLLTRGYRTGAFSANSYRFDERRFGRGFQRFEDIFTSLPDMAIHTLYGRKLDVLLLKYIMEDYPTRRSAADINEAFLRWLDRDRTKPFFAFLNYFDVHGPYLPPKPYRTKFSELSNPGLPRKRVVSDPQLTPLEAQGERDAYDGAIAYVDEQIGRLVQELEARGLGDNTVLIVTSDHGEGFGEHGSFGHRNHLYREMIHVPLIIRAPGRVPAGARISTPVTNAAIPATVMELVAPQGQGSFGRASLAPLWKGSDAVTSWEYPLSELEQAQFEPLKRLPLYHGAIKSLVTPEWHYIVHQTLGEELYDWANDPQERTNLADTPQGRKVRKELAAYLTGLIGRDPWGTGKAQAAKRGNPGTPPGELTPGERRRTATQR
jgi:arylsulfatase A-like enzyme